MWRSLDGGSFEAVAPITSSAVFGTLMEPLKPGPLWRFDSFNTLLVQLERSALHSASLAEVLAGANALALLAAGREAEIIQFTEAELVDARSYRLSGLLRGVGGTEAAGGQPWPEGTRLVRLDASLLPVARGVGELGRSYVYRVGPVREDHGGENVTERRADVGGRALRPLSPVHLRARRGTNGVAVSFIRRTRVDGDGWDALEVPLGEAQERYRLDILHGEAVVRVLESDTPFFLYRAEDEVADFGSPRRRLSFRVMQLSQSVGAGDALSASVLV